ncbi:MAG: hypothetical protein ACHQXA_01775 [Gemmatimonadales bacterium]
MVNAERSLSQGARGLSPAGTKSLFAGLSRWARTTVGATADRGGPAWGPRPRGDRGRPVPIIVTHRSTHPVTRRLLLVTYHFPPDPAVGAQRWQKLVRYAVERGWGVDVIALHLSALPRHDLGRVADLPSDVAVYGVRPPSMALTRLIESMWRVLKPATPPAPHADPTMRSASRATEGLRWWPRERRDLLRAYHVMVDHAGGRRWAQHAVQQGLALLKEDLHQLVISSGPPHCAHLAARSIAERAGLPFVMDLRDPWRLQQRLPDDLASPLWVALAARAERRCMEVAARIVVNTDLHRDALRGIYPSLAERILTIQNGWDDDQLPAHRTGSRFMMAYAGTIYLDRDPRPFFRAAARVAAKYQLTSAEFGIEFMGVVSELDGMPLTEMAAAEGIGRFLTLHSPRSQAEAREFLARASLLLVLPQDTTFAIPAKLFEYLRFEAWVLALASKNSAVEVVLRESEADVVAPDDVDAIAAVIERRFLLHRDGVHPFAIARDGAFGRRRQAEALFDIIDALGTQNGGGGPPVTPPG